MQDPDDYAAKLPALIQARDDNHQFLAEVSKEYDEGLEYNRTRTVREFQLHMGNANASLLKAGKALLVIRANEQFEDFVRIAEDDLGLSKTSAYRYMAVTKRLLQPHLQEKFPALGKITHTKIINLMDELSDDEIEEFADGKTVLGVNLDEAERMTTRELKAALRQAKADKEFEIQKLKNDLQMKQLEVERKDKIIADKSQKLDDLAYKPDPTEMEKAEKVLQAKQALNSIASRLYSEITILGHTHLKPLKLSLEDKYEDFELTAATALGQIAYAIRELAKDWGVIPELNPPEVFKQAAEDPGKASWDYVKANMPGWQNDGLTAPKTMAAQTITGEWMDDNGVEE